MTQIGVAARRVVADREGGVTRTVYYRPVEELRRWPPPGPVTDAMLRVYSTTITCTDQNGRPRIEQSFGPGGLLQQSEETSYRTDLRKAQSTVVWKDLFGSRRHESTLAPDTGRTTTLVCNERGEIVTATGDVPEDPRLVGGWGPILDGLQLRLSPFRSSGPVAAIDLMLTIRNVAPIQRSICEDPSATIELTDARGHRVPPTPQAVRAFAASAARLPTEDWPGCGEWARLLNPGEADLIASREVLEIFGALAPGTYTAVARHCIPGSGEGVLESNRAEFTVGP